MQIPDLRYADASEDDLDDQRHHSRANISQGCKVGQAPMVDTRQRAAKNARAPVFPPRAQHHHSSDSVVAHHDFDGYSDDEYENVQQSSPVFEKASTRRVKTPTSRVNEDNGSKRAARVSFAHDESSLAGNSRETIHDLKAEMLAKFGPLPKQAATGRKRLPEHDPENHEIKRLRCEERLPWNEIAERLNRERVLNGKSRLSEAAIYSRFVRNSPLIAQVKGDAEFDPREYMYMKQSRKGGGSKKPVLPPSFTEHHDLLLMESYAEARAKFWVYVAEQLSTASGKEYSPEHCAERFNQL
ncbi:hypothetical protein EJ08DRAFT_651510 [Tothia fuscella]|uniref:Myb-like domain-containing protein n=1 Tax=Tothia fuscella TaxID=1048955 RepID=A0A9P4NLG5_9PEZI|nr:hypothetical protein EJ08DRAFT_651510 [Tothia fuscella]